MATPRKHWFRVADSVAHEPWSNDVCATFTRLLGHLNTRWAREGRTPNSACEVLLSRATAMQLTGSGSLARARSILHELATHVSLVVSEQGANTLVRWPNFAKFQKLASESGAEVETVAEQLVPPPQDAPARRKTQDAEQISPAAKPAPPQASSRTRKSQAPDALSDEQWCRLASWVASKEPWAADRLTELVEACLGHFKASGKPMVDWVLTIENWIRNERTRFGGRGGVSNVRRIGPLETAGRNIAARIAARGRGAAPHAPEALFDVSAATRR